jgi:hypothetical protein
LSEDSVPELENPVGALGQRCVVGDDDERRVVMLYEIKQYFVKPLARLAVEIARRLIRKERRWLVGQGACHGYPLLLATGQFRRAMFDSLGQTDLVQEVQRSLPSARTIDARNELWHHYILECREVAQQVMKLEDEADKLIPYASQFLVAHPGQISTAERDAPGGREIKAPQYMQERGFSRPARAYDRDRLSPVDHQVDPSQYPDRVTRSPLERPLDLFRDNWCRGLDTRCTGQITHAESPLPACTPPRDGPDTESL